MDATRTHDPVAFLESLGDRGIQLGLTRVRRLLTELGDPQQAFPALHIAGTNGKGSVSAALASILEAQGYRVGLYTSPHLFRVEERIALNGTPITRTRLIALLERLQTHLEGGEYTYFEALTALAFLYFAEEKIEVAVVETGLGGRLDATTLVQPWVSVITTVDRDHVSYLGESVEAIAREKAGILKPGVPVVVGERKPAILELLQDLARQVGAPWRAMGGEVELEGIRLSWAGTRFDYASARNVWEDLDFSLIGYHQAENAALALTALEALSSRLPVTAEAIRRGLTATRWPGRFQPLAVEPVPVVVDVAHNPAGVERLVETMGALLTDREVVGVTGILADKEYRGMLERLAPAVKVLILTTPESAPAERRLDWATHWPALRGLPVELQLEPSVEEAVDRALTLPLERPAVVVTGSFYTVAEALVAWNERGGRSAPQVAVQG